MNGSMSLIVIASNWSDYALTRALYTGVCAGLVAMVVLLFNAVFRRSISSRQMGLLWGVVLLRLLIPVAPSSPLSLQNLLPSGQTELNEPNDALREPGAAFDGVAWLQASATTPVASDSRARSAPNATPPLADLTGAGDPFFMMLSVLWLTGGAAGLIWTTIVHWQFCRRLKHVVACADQRECTLWERCCKQAGVRRGIPILLFDGVQQPAVLGLFRPRLLLPTDATELNDQQLRMVMLHELAHVRHLDIAANWLLVVIRAIHWWNPVYWLAAARFRSLREQSCDAFAIRRIEGQSTHVYSELLLTLAERPPMGPAWRVMLPVSILGFFSSFFRKRGLRNRLKALRSAGVARSRWHTAGVAGLVGLVAVGGLTDASTSDSTSDTATSRSSDWLPRAGHDWNNWITASGNAPGTMVTRIYDIERALDRIAAEERTKDDARVKLSSLLRHILRYSVGQDNVSTNNRHGPPDLLGSRQGSVEIDGTTLTVSASLDFHAEIVRMLKAWEQSGLCQISIETRFITDERDIASAVGVSWQYLEAFSADRGETFPSNAKNGIPGVRATSVLDVYLPVAVATLNDQQASALVEAAQRGSRANLLPSPKVTVFNGQRASILDCTQSPFVVGIQDVSVDVQRPRIAVIDEGIKLTLRAIRSGDGKKVQLDARVELSHIDEVRTASTLLRGEPATIQIPRVRRCRIDASSEVQDGQTLLIGCIPTYEQKRFFYVLLTVRSLAVN